MGSPSSRNAYIAPDNWTPSIPAPSRRVRAGSANSRPKRKNTSTSGAVSGSRIWKAATLAKPRLPTFPAAPCSRMARRCFHIACMVP